MKGVFPFISFFYMLGSIKLINQTASPVVLSDLGALTIAANSTQTDVQEMFDLQTLRYSTSLKNAVDLNQIQIDDYTNSLTSPYTFTSSNSDRIVTLLGELGTILISETSGLASETTITEVSDGIGLPADAVADDNKNAYSLISLTKRNLNYLDAILQQLQTNSNNAASVVTFNSDEKNIFGRLKTAQMNTQLYLKCTSDKLPRLVEEITGGGAVATTLSAATGTILFFVNAAGAYQLRRTFQRGNYQPGKSIGVDFSFYFFHLEAGIKKKVGYYTSTSGSNYEANQDGFFLLSDGITTNTIRLQVWRNGTLIFDIPQSQWNDPLNGTGASGINIDWTRNQLINFEMAWLGVGGIKMKVFGADGQYHTVHEITAVQLSTAVLTGAFMKPNQPLSYYIYCASGSGSFSSICSQIYTDGLIDKNGRSIGCPPNNSLTALGTNTSAVYPILAIRLNSTGVSGGDKIVIEELDFLSKNNGNGIIYLMRNPTLSGSLTFTTLANTSLEYAQNILAAVTISSPTTAECLKTYSITAGTRIQITADIIQTLGSQADGTGDMFVVAYQQYDTNSQIRASLNCEQF